MIKMMESSFVDSVKKIFDYKVIDIYRDKEGYYEYVEQLTDSDKEVELIDELCRLNELNKIVDIGCGGGRLSIPLLQKGYDVTGVDVSPLQIENYRKNTKNGFSESKSILSDIRYISTKELRFEVALMLNSVTFYFEKQDDLIKVLENINNMLEQRGLLIFNVNLKNKAVTLNNEIYEFENIIYDDSKNILINRFIKIVDYIDYNDLFITSIVMNKEMKFSIFEEHNIELKYNLELVKEWLAKTNFEIINLLDAETLERFDNDRTEDVLIICRKK